MCRSSRKLLSFVCQDQFMHKFSTRNNKFPSFTLRTLCTLACESNLSKDCHQLNYMIFYPIFAYDKNTKQMNQISCCSTEQRLWMFFKRLFAFWKSKLVNFSYHAPSILTLLSHNQMSINWYASSAHDSNYQFIYSKKS